MNKAKHLGRGFFESKMTIQISNIEVDEKYFSFDYKVWVNSNSKPIEGNYDSDHVHSTKEEQKKFKKLIEESYGHQLVLETIIEENLWR